MHRPNLQLQPASFTSDGIELPREVTKLFPREQQIAAIVYGSGLVTAKDVELHLSQSVTNAAVRSFLNRLVRKGLLLQQRCGKHGAIVYAPALTDPFARELAVRQFADDFCGGSLTLLADELGEFFSRPPCLSELLQSYDRSPPISLRELTTRTHEIATIVYRLGASTSRDIQAHVGDPLTRSCINTLLNRMICRGLIKKRRSGRHREIAYLPALITRQVRRLALKRFIEDRFEDSPGCALRLALQLIRAQEER